MGRRPRPTGGTQAWQADRRWKRAPSPSGFATRSATSASSGHPATCARISPSTMNPMSLYTYSARDPAGCGRRHRQGARHDRGPCRLTYVCRAVGVQQPRRGSENRREEREEGRQPGAMGQEVPHRGSGPAGGRLRQNLGHRRLGADDAVPPQRQEHGRRGEDLGQGGEVEDGLEASRRRPRPRRHGGRRGARRPPRRGRRPPRPPRRGAPGGGRAPVTRRASASGRGSPRGRTRPAGPAGRRTRAPG